MDLQKRIIQLKSQVLRKIEDAAKTGNTSSVVSSSKIVEEIESLEQQLNQVINSLDSIEKLVEQNGESLDSVQISSLVTLRDKSVSPKKKGEERRTHFVKRAQNLGINILQMKGVRYKVNNRNLIGIAYSSETRPNRWFLGLPPENFDTIVLVCERKNGQILNFIFSKDFYDKVKNLMSTDDNGQLKYNIALRNGEYQFMIPLQGYEKINSFLANFDNLRQL
ncbi:MAG: hypothetical protein ACE5IR_15560 [bacterium]